MRLTQEHISYITKDLNFKGIIADEVQDELIDHICSSVEKEMENGTRFIDAYESTLRSFGYSSGLLLTQRQALKSRNPNASIMFRNYLVVALRNLRKQKFHSIINVTGLAIGIAACLVIVLYIKNELSYDSFHKNGDRIVRVDNEIRFGNNHVTMAKSPAPFASTLQQEYPEIESTVRFCSYGTYLVKKADGQVNIKEENVMWTDSTFFDIFSIPVVEGNPAKALTEQNTVAVSRRIAEKYYPNESALGKSLVLDNKYHATISAVYENIPANSHFHFDILIAMLGDWPVAKESRSTVFLGNNFNTYLLLKDAADAAKLEDKLPLFISKYVGPQFAKIRGEADFSMDKFRAAGNMYNTTLTPLRDIHLHSDLAGEFEPNGSVVYIYLLATIALFILAIACVNFMNLSTARAGSRAKEVGVRKVMGSLRSHLVRQFLAESILITISAFVLALFFAYAILPYFNELSSKSLSLPWGSTSFYLILLTAALLVGVLAGVYPSFFLSAFKPVQVLKGAAFSGGGHRGAIRSALVVFQFSISILLIIGAITVNRQLEYIQTKKLGFEKDQLVIVKDAYALRPNVDAFKTEGLKVNSVESCTITGFIPTEGPESSRNDRSFWKEGQNPESANFVSIQNWRVDHDYIRTFQMNVVLGRQFSEDFPSDVDAVILNQEAVSRFGLGENPIGKKIVSFDGRRADGSPDFEHTRTWTVIGVIENFHFSSLRNNIDPLGLFLGKSDGFYTFKINGTRARETVSSLEALWKSLAPDQPFQYSFLNDDFARMYAAEGRIEKIFSSFAALAIFIACLGLFALTAFTAEQRTKEIGIRKVLGASVGSIVVLLSRDFGKLILIAFLIAIPFAWMGIDWWLKGYTYKTEIGVAVYVIAGLSALVVSWVTMSFQSFKAASTNPVKSLRSE